MAEAPRYVPTWRSGMQRQGRRRRVDTCSITKVPTVFVVAGCSTSLASALTSQMPSDALHAHATHDPRVVAHGRHPRPGAYREDPRVKRNESFVDKWGALER